MFFADGFSNPLHHTDGDILRIGAILYRDEPTGEACHRVDVISENRRRGSPDLALGPMLDGLLETPLHAPASFGELPADLLELHRLTAEAESHGHSSPEDLPYPLPWRASENYRPTAEDIADARVEPGSSFAYDVTRNPNYHPTAEDIAFARENAGSWFALGIVVNRNFHPTAEDRAFARENLGSSFAGGLAENPNLFLLLGRYSEEQRRQWGVE